MAQITDLNDFKCFLTLLFLGVQSFFLFIPSFSTNMDSFVLVDDDGMVAFYMDGFNVGLLKVVLYEIMAL